jgi:serine protease AprX
MDDNSTPFDVRDDKVAAFSSYGSTIDGFLKPELIAPGVRVKDFASNTSFSGTSQATAATAGVVALMIEQDPSLTPDEIKCRLISTATQAKYSNDQSASSQLAHGAGLVNASAAINSTEVACANQGLNIFNDISKAADYFSKDLKEADGGIWYDANKKASRKDLDGVIWYDTIKVTDAKASALQSLVINKSAQISLGEE